MAFYYVILEEGYTPHGEYEYHVLVKDKFFFTLQFPKKKTVAKFENALQDVWQSFKAMRREARRQSQMRVISVFENQVDAAQTAAATIPPPAELPTPADEVD